MNYQSKCTGSINPVLSASTKIQVYVDMTVKTGSAYTLDVDGTTSTVRSGTLIQRTNPTLPSDHSLSPFGGRSARCGRLRSRGFPPERLLFCGPRSEADEECATLRARFLSSSASLHCTHCPLPLLYSAARYEITLWYIYAKLTTMSPVVMTASPLTIGALLRVAVPPPVPTRLPKVAAAMLVTVMTDIVMAATAPTFYIRANRRRRRKGKKQDKLAMGGGGDQCTRLRRPDVRSYDRK